MPRFRLTEELRNRLKTPLGELVRGPPKRSIVRLRRIIESEEVSRIICVGDYVSKLLLRAKIPVNLAIIDNKVMRRRKRSSGIAAPRVFQTDNPAGAIEVAAWATVREAMQRPRSAIVVRGEEDLLALVAIAESPTKTLVIYGQPRQGMVVVRVGEEKKSEVESILSEMLKEG